MPTSIQVSRRLYDAASNFLLMACNLSAFIVIEISTLLVLHVANKDYPSGAHVSCRPLVTKLAATCDSHAAITQ